MTSYGDGVYKSTDAGKSWKLINGHRVLHSRAWYYIHLAADPVDENTVYVLNVPFLKSIDGGKTFSIIKTQHGDHHDHWINPENNKNMAWCHRKLKQPKEAILLYNQIIGGHRIGGRIKTVQIAEQETRRITHAAV